jgi:hypothetical protein
MHPSILIISRRGGRDFLEAGFYVLYNFGTANIRHADGLVNFIKDLLQDGIKVLVAIDKIPQYFMLLTNYLALN